MKIEETERYFKVSFEYDYDKVAYIKSIPGAFWRWEDKDRKVGAWFILKYRKAELENFKSTFGYKDTVVVQAPERFDKIPPLPELMIQIPQLLLTPRPYQAQGIAYCLEHDNVLIGDQPGLGKTLTSIAAVIAKNNFPCLVICPATLKENWRREWMKVAGRRAMILSDKVKTSWPTYYSVGMCDVFITNYESLTKFFVEGIDTPEGETLKLKHVRFRENKNLFKSVIIDECHKIRNSATIQSKLTAGVAMGKPQVLALSGTAVVNSPKDLWPILAVLGKHKLFGKQADFNARYCEVGPRKKPGNLKELNYYLNLNCFFRREKHDVLKDLPPKVRQVMYCDIITRREYDHAEQEFVSYLREVKKCNDEEVARKLRGQFMVKMGILKNISARGKMNEVKQYVDEILEGGEKVILFCYLQEMIHAVKALYPHALTIYGEDSLEARDRAVDLFQNDPRYPIIVCNYKSGGVGLTLTAASRVGFIEEPWTFADCEQCEDRAHRIGQKNLDELESIQCTYFMGSDTIDDYCHDIVMNKKTIADMVHGSTEVVQVDIVDQLLNLFTKKREPKRGGILKKYIELAKKLHELWMRGDPHEKENAKAKLNALMAKHGFTMDDIEREKVEMRPFKVLPRDIDIFTIMVANIFGSGKSDQMFTRAEMKDTFFLSITHSEYIEMEAKYEFFKAAYKKEYLQFIAAFVYRQDLFAADAKASEEEPTEDDYAAFLIAQEMKKYHFKKQLKFGNFGIEK